MRGGEETPTGSGRRRRWPVAVAAGIAGAAAVAALASGAVTRWTGAGPRPPAASAEAPAPTGVRAPSPQRHVAEGLAIEFTATRAGSAEAPLLEGDTVDVRFRVTDATTGEPVRGLDPGAWMDLGSLAAANEGERGDGTGAAACQERVGLYLKGLVGIRPLIDLNGHHLLVLNQDPSISVIDPVVGMTGKTSLFATVILPGAGMDWVRAPDGKRLWVSIPSKGLVAAVDTESFRVADLIDTGGRPTRVALGPDGRFLWVGDDAGGVVVVDAAAAQVTARIPTGRGHHELAFAGDRTVFVTNREEGTVSALDVDALAKRRDLAVGAAPVGVAVSPLSGAAYVADGASGELAVIGTGSAGVTARIPTAPGVGPVRFSDDGRWGFAVHPREHAVFVVDAARHEVVHRVALPGQPYQVAFTDVHAYVRLLDSERVPMIRLSSLGAGREPIVQGFAAGGSAPGLAPDLVLADTIVRAAADAAVFVLNPADSQTYYYMEGMNAPMGSFRNYGHAGRAATVIDRSLREVEPGVHAGRVRLPAAGSYQVALLLDTPRVLHCFTLEAAPNPALRRTGVPLEVEYLDFSGRAVAGAETKVRFRLRDAAGHAPRKGLSDVAVRTFGTPARPRLDVPAREVGDGVYEATVRFPGPGAYYVHVGAPSAGAAFGALPFRTLVVTEAAGGGEGDGDGAPRR